jgi:hypothetical protein
VNDNNTPQLPNRLVTLRWFDDGFCPDQYLADLVAQFETPSPEEIKAIAQGLVKPVSMTTFVQGNAVDFRITSFHGLIDLDKDMYPVLTNARAGIAEQIFSRAAFSLADVTIDSGDKLFSLREFIKFVQHQWALPGLYIGLSMHVVREIADLAYWKNHALEFRLDKRGDALVMAAHFPKIQDRDFVINIFPNEQYEGFDAYPTLKEWLRFFRNYVKEVAELWTITIVVNKDIAEKIGCLNDSDVVITNEQMPPYPCL